MFKYWRSSSNEFFWFWKTLWPQCSRQEHHDPLSLSQAAAPAGLSKTQIPGKENQIACLDKASQVRWTTVVRYCQVNFVSPIIVPLTRVSPDRGKIAAALLLWMWLVPEHGMNLEDKARLYILLWIFYSLPCHSLLDYWNHNIAVLSCKREYLHLFMVTLVGTTSKNIRAPKTSLFMQPGRNYFLWPVAWLRSPRYCKSALIYLYMTIVVPFITDKQSHQKWTCI